MQLEELYRLYFQNIYRYLLKLSGSAAVAEDLTSEVFFKAISAIDGFRGDCEIRIWLLRIAKNSYFSYVRKNGREEGLEAVALSELPDPGPDVSDVVADRMEAARARNFLHLLPEPYKEVFMWRVFAELDFQAIGAVFGKSANWACVTYYRARKMIQENMEEQV